MLVSSEMRGKFWNWDMSQDAPAFEFSAPLILPTFRGQKKRFFFYLTKLTSDILPNVSKKKVLKPPKAPELLEKPNFK